MRRRSDLTGWMIAGAAALAASMAEAVAQPQTSRAMAGAWVLETVPHRVTGCVLRGAATITPKTGSAFDVRVRADETCPDGQSFKADETCKGVVAGTTVTIRCTLVRATPPNYNPDSFQLEWTGGDQMTGRLIDSGFWNEPVTWRRAAPALVS